MRNVKLSIFGGTAVQLPKNKLIATGRIGLVLLACMLISTSAFGQGSIFGTVSNSDLTTPANGQIVFVGFLDDTDEEIRLESSVGAGYDNGNWFDDFQNYLTAAAGNPYDHLFFNLTTGEGFQLSGLIPNNSFQQENIVLAPVAWPSQPLGIQAVTVSSSSVVISWSEVVGHTYHVYRRAGTSAGSFYRIDDPLGPLSVPGVAGNYFVDNNIDGVSSYSYVIIAEDATGNLSPHSAIVTANTASVAAPILIAIDPDSGTATGGTIISVSGSGFDVAGVDIVFGVASVPATVNTPFSLTVIAPPGVANTSVDFLVQNNASGLISNIMSGGYRYLSNVTPTLAAIGPQTVIEGNQLTFTTSATDADGDIPIMTSSALPGTATYVDNGDGTGTFDWTTTFTDGGIYGVTFYATDVLAPTAVDSEVVQITVSETGNQPPVLAPVNDTTVTEGQTLALVITATDADGETPTLSVTDAPVNSAFVDNLDGTADFTFTPDNTQAGIYPVIFKALDAALDVDSIIVQITVTDQNQPPVLAAIGPQNTAENVLLSFQVFASDVDGATPVLSTSSLPDSAVFTDSLNGGGLFEWTPTFADAGVYTVTFYAADGDFPTEIDSEVVAITVVDAGNQPPVLAAVGPQTVAEGGNLNLLITATDIDGTIPTVRAENIPLNATFVANLDGTGVFDFNPDFLQTGLYTVAFIADDGQLADSEFVDITVTDAGNVAPVIDPIGDFTINEGESLIITISATDPDGQGAIPTLSVSAQMDRSDYTFVDNGDGTGTFTYLPDYYDAGTYLVNFFATDAGNPPQTGGIVSVITTLETNQPPVFEPAGAFGVVVNNLLQFTIAASDPTDPDSTHTLMLSTLGLPLNAVFTDYGDNTGMFEFIPDSTQVGPQVVTFLALDQGSPQNSVTMAVNINVVAGNIPPILDPIGPQVITEGQTLTLNITASDPDGPSPAIDTANAPEGSTIVDNGDGTAVYTFTPDYFGRGRLTSVTIVAFDGIAVTKEIVLIQIYDAGNQAPVFDSIPAPAVLEGLSMTHGVTAYDPDGDAVTLTLDESVVTIPPNSSFTDLGDGLGEIAFSPDFTQSGMYDFWIVAWDGPEGDSATMSDTVVVTVEVLEFGNHVPVLATVVDQTILENVPLNLNIVSSDLDGDPIVLSTGTLPLNASFTDNTDGTGDFLFAPDFDQEGDYPIWFYATDGTDTDSMLVNITVNDNNRLPFVFDDGPRTIYEADTLIYVVQSLDFDGTMPELDAYLSGTDSLATNMTFTDNYDGTGTLVFMPDYTQGGSVSNPAQYFLVFSATDEVYPAVTQTTPTVTFSVIDRNKPPSIEFPPPGGPGPYTVNEGGLVEFSIGVVDDDAITPPNLTAINTPDSNFVFTYNATTRLGQFQFTPNFVQAGTYLVWFIATDDRSAADTAIVQIDVLEAGNQPPSFGASLADTLMVPTNHDYQIIVAPYDPEHDSITVEAFPMLPGATWNDNADGTWIYAFNADSSWLGNVYEITFVVTDYPNLATDTLVTHPRIVAFLRGDLDADNIYSVNDIAFLIHYLFRNGPEPIILESADINDNGTVTIGDLSYLIYYMFRRGPQPPP